MTKKININDPNEWAALNWDEPQVPEVLKKTDGKIAIARNNRLRATTPEFREKLKKGIKDQWDSEKGSLRKEKLSEKMKKFHENNVTTHTEETKNRISESSKKLHQDPEFRENWERTMRERDAHGWSEEQRRAHKIGAEKLRKPIITPHGEFNSLADMAKYYGVGKASCQEKLRAKPHLYYRKDKGPCEPTLEDVIYTPYGKFRTKKEAMNAYTGNITNKQTWWRKISKLYPDQFYIRKEVKREWN